MSARRSAPTRTPRKTSAPPAERGFVGPELPLVRVDVEAGPGRHGIRDVIERWDLRVRFDVCRPMGRDHAQLLQVVELSGDPAELGEAERFLRHHPEIRALTVLGVSPSRRFVRAVTAMPASCREIMTGGAVCAGGQFLPGGRSGDRGRGSTVIPRSPEAMRGLERLRARGPDGPAPIRGMHRFVPDPTLTPRQASALEAASRPGFSTFPRRRSSTRSHQSRGSAARRRPRSSGVRRGRGSRPGSAGASGPRTSGRTRSWPSGSRSWNGAVRPGPARARALA